MLHLYAVIDSAPPDAAVGGAGTAGLLFVSWDGIACAAGHAAARSGPPTSAEVLRHQAVIEALMPVGALLPLRFGTMVDNAHICRDFLARNAAALRGRLDWVRHCAEYALRVCGLEADPARAVPARAEGPGAAHLRTLLRRVGGWPPSDAAFPHDRLLAHAKDRVLWPRTEGSADLRASFLVPQAQTERFLADLSALMPLRPDLVFTCTGPWPPYSFADIGGGTAAP